MNHRFHNVSVATLTTLLISAPALAHAQLVISEIMYDLEVGSDTGREWIEIFNAGTEPVAVPEWRLFEGTTNHTLTAYTGGETLAAGSYAVIADNPGKFLEDNPGYPGILFDSAFSLNNTGEVLTLRCCLTGQGGSELTDQDSVTYSADWGAKGDGKTLERDTVSGSTFTPGLPTPGKGVLEGGSLPDVVLPAQDEEETDDTQEAEDPVPQTPFKIPDPGVFMYGGDDRTVLVGADVPFSGQALSKDGKPISTYGYSWNFGDGGTVEGQHVTHRWTYPGTYVVALTSPQDGSQPDFIRVVAEPASLTITRLPDGGLAVTNKTKREVNLSQWQLSMGNKTFRIPEHTIVAKGATVSFPHTTTGLNFIADDAALLYPNGERAAKLAQPTPAVATPAATPVIEEVAMVAEEPETEIDEETKVPAAENSGIEGVIVVPDIETREQAAAAVVSVKGAWHWWYALFGILVLAAAGGIVYIRRSQRDEWDITEEI
jgi:hypothetical protein